MKRTRRVEVIRYSRRSTLISNEVAWESDLAAEQVAIDLLLGMPDVTESPVEETKGAEKQTYAAGVPAVAHRRRPLRFLKRLIRG